MKKENGQNQFNDNLKKHKPFGLYDNDGLFAIYKYDDNLKRYQSDYGYLLIEDVIYINKDETDERYILWEG